MYQRNGVPQATSCGLLKQRETAVAATDGDRKQMCTGKVPVVEAVLVNGLMMASHVMPT